MLGNLFNLEPLSPSLESSSPWADQEHCCIVGPSLCAKEGELEVGKEILKASNARSKNADKAFSSLFSNAAVLLKTSVFTHKIYYMIVIGRVGVSSGNGAVRHLCEAAGTASLLWGHSKLNISLFSLAGF